MRKLLVVLAVAALGGLPACGGGDEDTASTAPEASTTQPAAKATTLSVEAVEPGPGKYAFTGIPQTIIGGLVEINLHNMGREGHEVQLVRFDPGHSADEVKKEFDTPEGAPIAPWLHLAGGAGPTPRTGQSAASKVLLVSGSYAFACFIPDENDVSHYKNGMFGTFTVQGGDPAATLPRTDTTITAKENAFDLPPLRAGHATITFANAGKEPHHVLMLPITQGKTADDAKKAFSSEGPPSGPPPVDFERATGTQAVDGGSSFVTDIDLTPGDYVFLCFYNDRAGGPPHFAKGMFQTVTIR